MQSKLPVTFLRESGVGSGGITRRAATPVGTAFTIIFLAYGQQLYYEANVALGTSLSFRTAKNRRSSAWPWWEGSGHIVMHFFTLRRARSGTEFCKTLKPSRLRAYPFGRWIALN